MPRYGWLHDEVSRSRRTPKAYRREGGDMLREFLQEEDFDQGSFEDDPDEDPPEEDK